MVVKKAFVELGFIAILQKGIAIFCNRILAALIVFGRVVILFVEQIALWDGLDNAIK